MTYLCDHWFDNSDFDNEELLSDAINNTNCSFYTDTTVTVYADGSYGDTSDYNTNDIMCNEHDISVRDYDGNELYAQAARVLENDTSYFVCTNDDHSPEDYEIFTTEDNYREHQAETHGQDEIGDILLDDIPAPPLPGTSLSIDAAGHRWHPDITERARLLALDMIQTQRRVHAYISIAGVLISNQENQDVHVIERQPTVANFRFWQGDFPNHFYVDVIDPHLTHRGSRTHASWA